MQSLSAVFHEVRNPLGVINLHAELILKNPEKAAASAEIISRTSRDLEKILTELLNFSKPLMLEKTRENLGQNISELVNMFLPFYEEKNVELIFKNKLKKAELINIDRIKLNRALVNLLKNALEFSKPGDKVEILLKKIRNEIFINVSDQGEGIPQENRDKIFSPYFTTRKNGTGIGLAETKKIIEAHEGTIYINSGKTKGTSFIIRLIGG